MVVLCVTKNLMKFLTLYWRVLGGVAWLVGGHRDTVTWPYIILRIWLAVSGVIGLLWRVIYCVSVRRLHQFAVMFVCSPVNAHRIVLIQSNLTERTCRTNSAHFKPHTHYVSIPDHGSWHSDITPAPLVGRGRTLKAQEGGVSVLLQKFGWNSFGRKCTVRDNAPGLAKVRAAVETRPASKSTSSGAVVSAPSRPRPHPRPPAHPARRAPPPALAPPPPLRRMAVAA